MKTLSINAIIGYPAGSIIGITYRYNLLFVISVAVACASLKLCHIPLREWLTEYWLQHSDKA